MKKIIGGSVLSIVSIILFLNIHNTAVKIMGDMTSWDTDLGKYLTAINETGGTAVLKWSVILLIFSITIIFIGCFEDNIKIMFDIIKRKFK